MWSIAGLRPAMLGHEPCLPRDKETKYAELVEGNVVASWLFQLRPANVEVTKLSGSSTLWLQLVLMMLLPGCSPHSWLGGGGGPAWPFLVPKTFAGLLISNIEAMEGVHS